MMIDIEILKKKLCDKNDENIICCEFEIKPSNISKFIDKIVTSTKGEGYIVIGVTRRNNDYIVNGISRRFNIDVIISTAMDNLLYKPYVENQMLSLDGKNICVIYVRKPVDYRKKVSVREKSKENFLLEDLYAACLKLQRNQLYNNVTEDERNDYIRDLLETRGYSRGYNVKDQTRQGKSYAGKKSGEIDLLIQNEKGLPIAIIEALILKSFDVNYLDKHIDKIYLYDTSGNKFNFIVSYVMVKDFESFFNKYSEHIKKYQYPYELIEVDEKVDDKYQYSDIRIIITTHNRNGKESLLYHICVKIQN